MRGPNVIKRVFIQGRQEFRVGSRLYDNEAKVGRHVRMGPLAKELGWPLEAEKGKEINSLNSTEETQPC